ncbi:SRPBCC family protein [Gordonia amicalis]|uniref:SRPBCC family protein n=2 Tax=Gordonia amicalis TaxID=89053 RepID=UPI0004675C26|nr:SRPBCC family protein [Gordonia amicalis]MCZ4581028.1 SRPBCC family protein [Gordonia amicalis]MDV7102108.1 SRPBCC family protein [Gordonia amicalis]
MPESNASVVVKQPLEKVWEFTTDPENAASYFPGTVELTSLSDGPVAVGTQWKGKTALLGRTMDWRGEYTRVDTQKGTEFKTIESPFKFSIHTDLEDTADGVRMSVRVDSASGLGGVFGKMADPIVTRIYQRSLTASIESIPDLMDAWLAQKG